MSDPMKQLEFRKLMSVAESAVWRVYDMPLGIDGLFIILRQQLSIISDRGRSGGILRRPQLVLKELAALAYMAEAGAIEIGLLDTPPEKGGPDDAPEV